MLFTYAGARCVDVTDGPQEYRVLIDAVGDGRRWYWTSQRRTMGQQSWVTFRSGSAKSHRRALRAGRRAAKSRRMCSVYELGCCP